MSQYVKGDKVKYRLIDAKRTGFGKVWKICDHGTYSIIYVECDDGFTRAIESKDVRPRKEGE